MPSQLKAKRSNNRVQKRRVSPALLQALTVHWHSRKSGTCVAVWQTSAPPYSHASVPPSSNAGFQPAQKFRSAEFLRLCFTPSPSPGTGWSTCVAVCGVGLLAYKGGQSPPKTGRPETRLTVTHQSRHPVRWACSLSIVQKGRVSPTLLHALTVSRRRLEHLRCCNATKKEPGKARPQELALRSDPPDKITSTGLH